MEFNGEFLPRGDYHNRSYFIDALKSLEQEWNDGIANVTQIPKKQKLSKRFTMN